MQNCLTLLNGLRSSPFAIKNDIFFKKALERPTMATIRIAIGTVINELLNACCWQGLVSHWGGFHCHTIPLAFSCAAPCALHRLKTSPKKWRREKKGHSALCAVPTNYKKKQHKKQ